jgi:hypothetical protein
MEQAEQLSVWGKIVRADNSRKTRFHDKKGNVIDAAALPYLPLAYLTAVLKRVGYRPRVPSISYRARRELDRMIRPDWRAIEYGAGGSTAWLASRCAFIHSIESNPVRYGILSEGLASKYKNIRYEFRDESNYADLSDHPDRSVNFALIDGDLRGDCVASVLRTIKVGGLVYLDNSDRAVEAGCEEWRAERLLYQAVRERGGMVRYFVDFAPSLVAPSQGMLVQLT